MHSENNRQALAKLRYLDQKVQCHRPMHPILSEFQYGQHIALLLSEMEALGFNRKAIYCAKKYFDLYLQRSHQKSPESTLLLLITCIRFSIQINHQDSRIFEFTPEQIFFRCEQKFSIDQINECYLELKETIQDDLHFPTPYDFAEIVLLTLPKNQKMEEILYWGIQFGLSLPEIRIASCEAIFFGSFLYTSRLQELNPFYENFVKMATLKWDEANEFSNILKAQVEEVQEGMDDEQTEVGSQIDGNEENGQDVIEESSIQMQTVNTHSINFSE